MAFPTPIGSEYRAYGTCHRRCETGSSYFWRLAPPALASWFPGTPPSAEGFVPDRGASVETASCPRADTVRSNGAPQRLLGARPPCCPPHAAPRRVGRGQSWSWGILLPPRHSLPRLFATIQAASTSDRPPGGRRLPPGGSSATSDCGESPRPALPPMPAKRRHRHSA